MKENRGENRAQPAPPSSHQLDCSPQALSPELNQMRTEKLWALVGPHWGGAEPLWLPNLRAQPSPCGSHPAQGIPGAMCGVKGLGWLHGGAEKGWGCADGGFDWSCILPPPGSRVSVFVGCLLLTCVPSLSPGCSSKSFKLYSPKEPPNGNAFPPFHPGTMLDRDVG